MGTVLFLKASAWAVVFSKTIIKMPYPLNQNAAVEVPTTPICNTANSEYYIDGGYAYFIEPDFTIKVLSRKRNSITF